MAAAPAPTRPARIAKSLLPPPPPPAPAPSPPAPTPDRRRWLAASLVALGIVGAFLLGVVVPQGEPQPEVHLHGRHGPLYPWSGPIVVVDVDVYLHYLNVSVRPALAAVGATFVGVSCDSPENPSQPRDRDGLLARLREARQFAHDALKENLRVGPPPQFEALHRSVHDVFDGTVRTADALTDCVQAGKPECPEAQARVVELLGDTGRLTRELKEVAAAPSL